MSEPIGYLQINKKQWESIGKFMDKNPTSGFGLQLKNHPNAKALIVFNHNNINYEVKLDGKIFKVNQEIEVNLD